MGQSIRIPGGVISLVDVDFNCPACGKQHVEEDYFKRMQKSNHAMIYMKCKGCKEKLGITTDMRGDVVVWLKKEEMK
jgi:transcription elongation factor Elf1